MSSRRFLASDAVGAFLWGILLASTGSLFGQEWEALLAFYHMLDRLALSLLLLAIGTSLIPRLWRLKRSPAV